MIPKRFGFTSNFLMERNTELYCRLKKSACGFKGRARACLLMSFPGFRAPPGPHQPLLPQPPLHGPVP